MMPSKIAKQNIEKEEDLYFHPDLSDDEECKDLIANWFIRVCAAIV
jgi:hypothetical protein